jgi:predicted XRE-type DNA-binding protein
MRVNEDIRKAIEEANLKYWQVAKKYNLSDGNFARLLRFELSKDKKDKIFKIIEELKQEEKAK